MLEKTARICSNLTGAQITNAFRADTSEVLLAGLGLFRLAHFNELHLFLADKIVDAHVFRILGKVLCERMRGIGKDCSVRVIVGENWVLAKAGDEDLLAKWFLKQCKEGFPSVPTQSNALVSHRHHGCE